MVAWYKHDIPAWMDATEALDDGPYRVFHVICQLIYLHEGSIRLNEKGIAGRCNMHVLAFRSHLNHLVTLGRLTVNLDGTIGQPRANLELGKIGQNRVNAGLGGSKSRKPLKDKEPEQAPLTSEPSTNITEKTREEETRPDETKKEDALASLALRTDGYTRSEPPLRIKAAPRVVTTSNEDAPNRITKRGTRVPSDFAIDDKDRRFAADLGLPPAVVEAETAQFIDYWSGVPGAKGLKLDWRATWRNRMRDLKKYQPTSRGPPSVRPLTEFQRGRQELKGILDDLHNFSERSDQSGTEDPRLLPRDPGERSETIRGGVGGDVIDLPTGSGRSRG